ncbi:MAG: recombination protein RecR [Clostridia bacterium]|nr:recombination protein RecR [Clostridia bacterium]
MKNFIEPIERLVEEFSRLPGVGKKTATRYAYKIINMTEAQVKSFADSMLKAKENVHFCQICGNWTDSDICAICTKGNQKVVCVVAEPKDILSLEKVRDFGGVYHVLHGLLDPMNGKGPQDINIKGLLERVQKYDVKEVIMATSPTVEGEATAMYIAKLLKPLNVLVTRIAQGVSLGTDLEYVDEVTLTRAIQDRKEL